MKNKNIELIIVKYINNEANHDDLATLELWLQNEKNEAVFNKFIKTEYLIASSMDEFDLEKAKQSVKKKVKTNRRKQRLIYYSKYAAAVFIFGFLVLPLIFNKPDTLDNKISSPIVSKETITVGTNKAILTLNNGKEILLNNGGTYKSDYIESDGEKAIYKKNNVSEVEIAYNYLTIPRGGQFQVELSDGTMVWLNSESKLKYPVNFIEGRTRSIELVYGEAYLEVSPSTNHNGSTFIVNTKIQNIEVLGTKFNIRAYQDEDVIYSTLAEGRILVSTPTDERILTPNLQSKINTNSPNISVSEVNVSEVIAWKNGIFSFKNMKLKDIMKTLSRWYDTQVIYNDAEIQNIEFTGVLGKDQNINDILTIITNSNGIAYDIKGSTIIFK